VNLENIEEVDYVWDGGLITELVGKTGCFDYIIASHVIEHTPDLVTFLQECSKLLTQQGVLCLVIPDKRYCFDHFSPITKTGEILDAWVTKRIRPTPGQIFEYLATSVKNNGAIAWSEKRVLNDSFELSTSFEEASKVFMSSIDNQSYYDAHCWRFTLNAFKLLIADLNKLGLTNFAIHSEYETTGCEFYIALKNSNDPFQCNRLEYLNYRLQAS
jgi:predicted SAM-dependent methyltransferase